MSVDFGKGWNSVTVKDNKPYISITLSDEFKALIPALKEFKFIMHYVQQEDKKNEKAPDYVIKAFVPRETTNKTTSVPNTADNVSQASAKEKESVQEEMEEIPY